MKRVKPVYETGPRYAVGQSVALASPVAVHLSRFSPATGLHLQRSTTYEILAILPAIGRSLQYKVRSQLEPYDRVVSEHEIIELNAVEALFEVAPDEPVAGAP